MKIASGGGKGGKRRVYGPLLGTGEKRGGFLSSVIFWLERGEGLEKGGRREVAPSRLVPGSQEKKRRKRELPFVNCFLYPRRIFFIGRGHGENGFLLKER